jgi:hypothetical protein
MTVIKKALTSKRVGPPRSKKKTKRVSAAEAKRKVAGKKKRRAQ